VLGKASGIDSYHKIKLRMRGPKYNHRLSLLFLLIVTSCAYEFPESPYPSIATLPVTNITSTGFMLKMEVTKLADEPIIEHGFIWGIKGEITVNSEKVILGPVSSTGVYSGQVEFELDTNTEYAARAYVKTGSYIHYDNGTVVFGRNH
jgi:hypothetical protein